MPEVLITGAGIAGEALAVLLARSGWAVTVVEIAPAPRTGGQTVDLRGGSRDVLARMGLLDAALAVLVPQRGIAWVDDRGRRLAAMPVEAFGGQGLVSSEELLRTDLAALLHRAALRAGVRYRFGDTVEALTDSSHGVVVSFRCGSVNTYDLVVGADGAHSRVRALRFGPEEGFRRPLGLAHAWFTLLEGPSTPALDGWNLVHNAPGRRAVAVRPGHRGEQQVGLTLPAIDLPPRDGAQGGDAGAAGERWDHLERVFSGVGWRTPELLAAARSAADFAMDDFDQIHLDRWVNGRVVLVGDAAWCASPLSGLGTALGLLGAEALADALGDGSTMEPDTDRATWAASLERYEEGMRPRVGAAQKLIPGRVAMVAPRSRLGIRLAATVMRVVQWPLLRPLTARIAAGSGHQTSPSPVPPESATRPSRP